MRLKKKLTEIKILHTVCDLTRSLKGARGAGSYQMKVGEGRDGWGGWGGYSSVPPHKNCRKRVKNSRVRAGQRRRKGGGGGGGGQSYKMSTLVAILWKKEDKEGASAFVPWRLFRGGRSWSVVSARVYTCLYTCESIRVGIRVG